VFRLVKGGLLVALPWLWFVVRDRWAPLDGLAAGLPAIAEASGLGLAIVAASTRRALPLVLALSIVGVAGATAIGPRLPISTPSPIVEIRLASMNVADHNGQVDGAVRTIAALDVDVIAMVEMGDDFWSRLTPVAAARFPYTAAVGEVGVRSRWPVELLRTPSPVSGARLIRVRIDAPDTPFILYEVHALNPMHEFSFSQQVTFVDRLMRAVEQETEPVVIAGDMNLSDRTRGYRILAARLHDAMRDGSLAGNTFEDGLWATLFLRIDHVFMPETWCAADPSRFEVPGSDHKGVAATIGPCPS
jgi:endonuclease/exonuclease/phosphatase (EEP) superfamily protein YafD